MACRVELEYRFLAECLEVAPILAHWVTLEWNRDNLDRAGYWDRVASYRSRTDRNRIPVTLVAFDHDLPVGMVTINAQDLPSRPDLTPWLASFYVVAGYRGRGIGSALHDKMLDHAVEMGLPELYLNTYQADRFYLERGWRLFEKTAVVGSEEGAIYRYELSPEKVEA